MSKKQHDERAAQGRRECPEKTWIIEGMRRILPLLNEGSKVLDVGCGNGEVADAIVREKACSVTCLDYVDSHLDRVRRKGHQTITCDMDREEDVAAVVQHYHKSFDVVISLEVIEHMFEPDVLLQLAHNVLAPGGVLILSTPNMAYITYRLYTLFRGNMPPGQGHHVAFFDARRLWQQLVVNGFDVDEVGHYGSGNFYLDRAIGAQASRFRSAIMRGLFWAGATWGATPMKRSGLIATARSSAVRPLGLSASIREAVAASLSPSELHQSLNRLRPWVNSGCFDEHPDFTQYCLNQDLLEDRNIVR